MITSSKITTLLVITLALWGQVRPQSQWQTTAFVNGPTGISVEAVEEQQWTRGPPNVVNGPTAFSVEAEELKNGDGVYKVVDEDLQATNDDGSPRYIETDVDLGNAAPDDDGDGRRVVNGPTGSSVQQEEQIANNRGVISTDPKENEKKKQLPSGYHMDTTDWSTDSPHWTFKAGEWEMLTLPDKDHPTLPAPEVPGPALVVVTEEYLKKVYVSREVEGLSSVTLHYRYYLSEGVYPNGIPELKVYLVKDELHTHQLAFETTLGRWSDNTVDVPETNGKFKILFEGRLNKLGNEIAVDDITISGISGDVSGVSDTVIPADPRLEEGSDKAVTTKNPDRAPLPPADEEGDKDEGDKEGTVKPDEEGDVSGDQSKTTKKPQEESEGPENGQETEKVTDKPEISGNVSTGPEETGVLQNNSDVTVQGNNTVDMVEGTGIPVQDKETNITDEAEIIENVDMGNDTLSNSESAQVAEQGNQTIELNESSEFTLGKEGEEEFNSTDVIDSLDNSTVNAGIHGGLNNGTEVPEVNATVSVGNHSGSNISTEVPNINATESVGNHSGLNNKTEVPEVNVNITSGIPGVLNNFTEAPVVNQTVGANFTTDGSVNLGENVTHGVNATVPTNVTGITNSPTNATLVTTVNPGAVTTEPLVNINQTVPAVSTNGTNFTEAPANNGTGGGINATDVNLTTIGTTPEILNPLGNVTTDQGMNINATTIPVIMINSTSPSGSNGSTPGNFSGIGSTNVSEGGGSNSWGVFKVFLIICLLGVIVLGFLYWRRQQRRDDEIPVFSRSSHSDYHNPTFTDDDANFASRGTGHNYKSFD